MADGRSPILRPDTKILGQYVDEQSSVAPKSPKRNNRHAIANSIDAGISSSFKNYESQLQGWSPDDHVASDMVPKIETLSISDHMEDLKDSDDTVQKDSAKNTVNKKKKSVPAGVEIPVKKPKLTKKERRELQEAQRIAKASGVKLGKGKASKGGVEKESSSGARFQYDDAKKVAKRNKNAMIQRTHAQKQMALFSHLPQYERESSLTMNVHFSQNEDLHPAILALGLKYSEGKITGVNSRCLAMLVAFKQVVQDYQTPPAKTMNRDLGKKIVPLIQFLIDCRPHSAGMGNAIRYFRNAVGRLPVDLPEAEAKEILISKLDTYIQERILLPVEGIVANAVTKIVDNDVILTYSSCHVIELILKRAKKNGKSFRVVIVDSRPANDGRILAQSLANYGIKCTYVLINALGYIMKEVTKVFLGATSFMSNGVAVARAGTAIVAMTSKAYNVPVLFCCETYKFSDRVQLDSITQNELGDPDELVKTPERQDTLSDWRDLPALKLLNLVFDVTPSQYVSMVITEAGMIPASAIPVLIREYTTDYTS